MKKRRSGGSSIVNRKAIRKDSVRSKPVNWPCDYKNATPTMVFETKLEILPVGYAESSARKGEKVPISRFGFLSSGDGDTFIKRLEGFLQGLLNNIYNNNNVIISPSLIDNMLVIINDKKIAKIYINYINIKSIVRVKNIMEKGSPVFSDDILDIREVSIDVDIPKDQGFFFYFSVGWQKAIIYDFEPLWLSEKKIREYNINSLFGSAFSYLMFQKRFTLSDIAWMNLLNQKWFLFCHLDNSIIDEIINHADNKWDIDDLLEKISDNTKRLIKNTKLFGNNLNIFGDHIGLINRAINDYEKDDFVSCISILYPRIEGILRSFYLNSGNENKIRQTRLIEAAVANNDEHKKLYSLLMPERFKTYLESVYFADFCPGSKPEVSRHSIAHGEAKFESFDKKSATIAILILYHIALFIIK